MQCICGDFGVFLVQAEERESFLCVGELHNTVCVGIKESGRLSSDSQRIFCTRSYFLQSLGRETVYSIDAFSETFETLYGFQAICDRIEDGASGGASKL